MDPHADQRRPWTVAALLLATADALSARFGSVSVRGELCNFTRAASGHCYFGLKDTKGLPGLLRCVLFRRAAVLTDFAPADGQHVELRGRLGVYDARGELQMIVESLQRVGAGTLYEEFLRLRDRLQAAGLFSESRKRLPTAMPQAVGVVTSPSGAALHDVLTALMRRAPHVRIVVYPSSVQGAEAPAALVAALQVANRRREVNILLLVRGGGSIDDLWAFNDERVVRAVAASDLPVICGVGHETDITLADLAADLRAPTPTAAAELAAPVRAELSARLNASAAALARGTLRALQAHAQRIDTLAARLGQPSRSVTRQAGQIDALNGRLVMAMRAQQRLQRAALLAAQQRLGSVDPRAVLQRGYAWVEDGAGRPVLSARALMTGQSIRGVWADGSAWAQVVSVHGMPAVDEEASVPDA